MTDRDKRSRLHKRLYECLGKIVTARRKRLGLSQEELAENAGVDRAFISKIERGQRKPSFGLVSDVAHGLRMRYTRLVDNCERCARGEDEEESESA